MGDPAIMSTEERTQAARTAREIFFGVKGDEAAPFDMLQRCADMFKVPAETMLLWLATLVLEAQGPRR